MKPQMLVRMQRMENPPTLLVGMYTVTSTLENSTGFPQEVKSKVTLKHSNCTTGILPQK